MIQGRTGLVTTTVPAVTPEKLSTVMDEWQKAAGRYIDVHAWQFTPKLFRTLLGQLRDLAFVNLEVERIYHTLCGRIEFFAILTKRT